MSIFTWLLIVFVIVLYLFLWVSKRELTLVAKKNKYVVIFSAVMAGFICWSYLFSSNNLDEWFRGITAALILLSFTFEGHGLTDTYFLTNPFVKSGTPFEAVDKVVIEVLSTNEVKLRYYRHGIGGPTMIFKHSVEELLAFFKDRLGQETAVEVLLQK